MSKQHIDYHHAVKELKGIFGKIMGGDYLCRDDVQEAFQLWVNKYETPSDAACLSLIDQIKLAGKTCIKISFN
jgi:hypothetical protein